MLWWTDIEVCSPIWGGCLTEFDLPAFRIPSEFRVKTVSCNPTLACDSLSLLPSNDHIEEKSGQCDGPCHQWSGLAAIETRLILKPILRHDHHDVSLNLISEAGYVVLIHVSKQAPSQKACLDA